MQLYFVKYLREYEQFAHFMKQDVRNWYIMFGKTLLVISYEHIHLQKIKSFLTMFWTLELASHLEDAPWPATKDELIDYSIRSGAPIEVIENLQELEDEGDLYEGLEDIWPDYPSQEDFFFNEDEY